METRTGWWGLLQIFVSVPQSLGLGEPASEAWLAGDLGTTGVELAAWKKSQSDWESYKGPW